MATKVTVITTPRNRVSINNTDRNEIRAVAVAPSVTNTLRNLTDVDSTDIQNNETLVYDAATDKFVVRPLPNITGGTF
jgi:hypothetical protein